MTFHPRRVALAAALLLAPTAAHAYPDGRITGRSMTGCNTSSGCHGTTAGASVEIMGPTSVMAGTTNEFTLVVRSTLAGFTGGGFDMSAAGPSGTTLAPSPAQSSTRMNGTDLVMSTRLPATAGAMTVRFNLVTPNAGMATIFAAGNATNGLGQSGDAWALAMYSVQVTGGSTADAGPMPDSGTRPDAAVPADSGSHSGVEAYDPGYSMNYNRCAVSPRGLGRARAGLTALGVAALLAALRRRSAR